MSKYKQMQSVHIESKSDELQDKLDNVVKIAQSKILALLSDYSNEQAIARAMTVFSSCPIVLENIDPEQNEFGKITQIGGQAYSDKIAISQSDIQQLDLNNQQSLDNALGTIIHEYAHKFRQINSQYGKMFEEAAASIFAEMCINYSKVKNDEEHNKLFNMLTSIDYQQAESQVRGILYILKQKNMDISMMTEYILGDENKFKQVCTQILGSSFEEYFNLASNTPTYHQNANISEKMISKTLTEYLKNNKLSYKDYWASDRNLASPTNLYRNSSQTLLQSVVNAGKDAVRDDEQSLYVRFIIGNKDYQKKEKNIDDEKRTRIKDKIVQSFNLSGKTKDEIYDQLVELCSMYIQHKSRNDEESQMFLDELNKFIPNIEEFTNMFKQLRISRLDDSILESMDLSNISFNQIYDKMNSIISKEQSDTEKQAEQMIQAMVDGKLDANGQQIADNQAQMTNGRQMGFAKVWILGILATLVSLGIIVLGILSIYN